MIIIYIGFYSRQALQNLYLYTPSVTSYTHFLAALLPYTALTTHGAPKVSQPLTPNPLYLRSSVSQPACGSRQSDANAAILRLLLTSIDPRAQSFKDSKSKYGNTPKVQRCRGLNTMTYATLP